MNRIIIGCLFILINISIFCENRKDNDILSMEELRVVNMNLLSTIDSITQTNRAATISQIYHIEFDRDILKPDLIIVNAYGDVKNPYPDLLGYFTYKGRTFFVSGDSINTTIFEKTKRFKDFDFSLPPDKFTSTGEPILRTFEDFAVWSMRYKSGRFRILSFFSNNEDDNWFNYIDDEYGEGSMDNMGPSYHYSKDGIGILMPGKNW